MGISISFLLQFPQTFLANSFAMKQDKTTLFPAKHAGAVKFLQNDLIVIRKNFQLVTLRDFQRATDLNGQNHSSQFIDPADNSRRFHKHRLFFMELSRILSNEFIYHLYNIDIGVCQSFFRFLLFVP